MLCRCWVPQQRLLFGHTPSPPPCLHSIANSSSSSSCILQPHIPSSRSTSQPAHICGSSSSSRIWGSNWGSNNSSSSNGSGRSAGGGADGGSRGSSSDNGVDLYLSILSTQTWEQLYDLFYDHRRTPSPQHCYGILIQLTELLPELQQRPSQQLQQLLQQQQPKHPGYAAAAAAAGAAGAGAGASGLDESWDGGWEALTASGKLKSWSQLTALRSLIRDVLRVVQVQLHQFSPHELIDLLEAALQLSRPSNVWLQAWQVSAEQHLKQLQLVQLMRVSEALLGYEYTPPKPWAGVWFIALQNHLRHCTSQQLAVISLALQHWGCKPPPMWTNAYMESLQAHMLSFSTSIPQVLTVIAAMVTLQLQPGSQWCFALEAVSREGLSGCSARQQVILLQGLQLLGHQVSAGWLQQWLTVMQKSLPNWDLELLAAGLVALGDMAAAKAALQLHDGGSSSGSGSGGSPEQQQWQQWQQQQQQQQANKAGVAAAADAADVYNVADWDAEHVSKPAAAAAAAAASERCRAGLLPAVAAAAAPLVAAATDAGPLVQLLHGFQQLGYAPSDAWLDLLLDEAAEQVLQASITIRQQHYPLSTNGSSSDGNTTTSSSSGSSSSSLFAEDGDSSMRSSRGSSGGGSSGGGSSSSSNESSAWLDQADDAAWQVESGSYQPDRNINIARKALEQSWSLSSLDPLAHTTSSSSSSSNNNIGGSSSGRQLSSSDSFSTGRAGRAAAAAATAAGPQSAAAAAASRELVETVLDLLSVVAAMKLPVEEEWVTEVLRALQGHCCVVQQPELQQLLLLVQELQATPDPDWVDQLLMQAQVDYSQLPPEVQLLLLQLLASSQTRPNNLWWQGFLASLQDSFPRHTPAQLVLLLMSLSDMGGRPPQAWLAVHESALLTAKSHSTETLNPDGWLLLLDCYGRLMYRPSGEFESAFERYMVGVLPVLSAGGLASLVASVGRLQLACSSQLEDGIMKRLGKVLPCASSSELQELVQGLLLLDLQLPSPHLRDLCEAAQKLLPSFSPAATCSLLQLLAVAGDFPPSPAWLSTALSTLQQQLGSLEALPALQLLQSLKAFHSKPQDDFMHQLQLRLLALLPKFDAMGVATVMQDLVECSCQPLPELQLVMAKHIKKGLARPSQGMGATPVWLLLDAVLRMQEPPAAAVLLDELLLQVGEQLMAGSMGSSRLGRSLLPPLVAALTPGGVWGGGRYTPQPGFCSALCSVMLQSCSSSSSSCGDGSSSDDGSSSGSSDQHQLYESLDPMLWLDLLVRFADLQTGFRPPNSWIRAAVQQVLGSWVEAGSSRRESEQQQQLWAAAPGLQLAALLAALGRLQYVPVELPGWPEAALVRLGRVLPDLQGHQQAAALCGVAQLFELALVAQAQASASEPPQQDSSSPSSLSSSSSSTAGWSGSSRSRWYDRTLDGFAAARPQLLAAADAASFDQLGSMTADDLALLGFSLLQLGHTPPPHWVQAWSAAASSQLATASGQAGVLLLAAAAGFEGRPAESWLLQLLQHCQQHAGELQLGQLTALARALYLLGFKLEKGMAELLVRAGQAQVVISSSAGDAGGDTKAQCLRLAGAVDAVGSLSRLDCDGRPQILLSAEALPVVAQGGVSAQRVDAALQQQLLLELQQLLSDMQRRP